MFDTCITIDKKLSKDKEGERSAYLSDHGLGTKQKDTEPKSASPWFYAQVLRDMLDRFVELTRLFIMFMKMDKWSTWVGGTCEFAS